MTMEGWRGGHAGRETVHRASDPPLNLGNLRGPPLPDALVITRQAAKRLGHGGPPAVLQQATRAPPRLSSFWSSFRIWRRVFALLFKRGLRTSAVPYELFRRIFGSFSAPFPSRQLRPRSPRSTFGRLPTTSAAVAVHHRWTGSWSRLRWPGGERRGSSVVITQPPKSSFDGGEFCRPKRCGGAARPQLFGAVQ